MADQSQWAADQSPPAKVSSVTVIFVAVIKFVFVIVKFLLGMIAAFFFIVILSTNIKPGQSKSFSRCLLQNSEIANLWMLPIMITDHWLLISPINLILQMLPTMINWSIIWTLYRTVTSPPLVLTPITCPSFLFGNRNMIQVLHQIDYRWRPRKEGMIFSKKLDYLIVPKN